MGLARRLGVGVVRHVTHTLLCMLLALGPVPIASPLSLQPHRRAGPYDCTASGMCSAGKAGWVWPQLGGPPAWCSSSCSLSQGMPLNGGLSERTTCCTMPEPCLQKLDINTKH